VVVFSSPAAGCKLPHRCRPGEWTWPRKRRRSDALDLYSRPAILASDRKSDKTGSFRRIKMQPDSADLTKMHWADSRWEKLKIVEKSHRSRHSSLQIAVSVDSVGDPAGSRQGCRHESDANLRIFRTGRKLVGRR
jgi:hypothetical protein